MKRVRAQKFKLSSLTSAQIAILEDWQETARRVWNMGLSLLLEHDDRTCLAIVGVKENGKPEWGAVPRSRFALRGFDEMPRPVRSSRFRVKLDDGSIEWRECSWIVAKGKNGGMHDPRSCGEIRHAVGFPPLRVGACCPIAIAPWSPPRLPMEPVGKYTLQYYFTQKNISTVAPYFADRFAQLPAWFARGVCEALSVAWAGYKKGDRGEPRFKRPGDLVSLSHGDAKKMAIVPVGSASVGGVCRDGAITLPKLGRTEVKWLHHNWGTKPAAKLALVPSPDGAWYLHLTDSLELEEEDFSAIADPCDRLAAIDATLHALKESEPGDRSDTVKRDRLIALRRLTRKLAAGQAPLKVTVHNQGEVLAEDSTGRSFSPLPRFKQQPLDQNGVIAAIDKAAAELQLQISRQELRARREGTAESNRLKANRRSLAKLRHRKALILSNARKKIAHFVVERSSAIDLITVPATQTPAPDPKIAPGTFDPAHYDPNGAKKVADKNQERSHLAPGEFVALIKAGASDRRLAIEVVKEKSKSKKGKKS